MKEMASLTGGAGDVLTAMLDGMGESNQAIGEIAIAAQSQAEVAEDITNIVHKFKI